jgi:hypothetical protein
MYSSFPGNNEGRFYFVKKLASQLVEAHMRNRLEIPHIPREIKSSIRRILRIPEKEFPTQEGRLETRNSYLH